MISEWLKSTAAITVPLFDTNGLEPRVFSWGGMRKLRRHPTFDETLIKVVEKGLTHERWQGFIYIMHFGSASEIEPLYIGKAERKGRTHELSVNIRSIRTNQSKFGRWGYRLAYHIGDLSHAIFREEGSYKPPDKKYERWAKSLFESLDPLLLRRPVYVSLISWYEGMHGPSGLVGSVPAVEKELIALCSSMCGGSLLNVDGR